MPNNIFKQQLILAVIQHGPDWCQIAIRAWELFTS
jgi:hypothetical protein